MRLLLSKFIKKEDYFLHADMWNVKRFPVEGNVINCGLGESNLLNIAGGIASEENTVYIYGVCGFIIHRLEQLKFSCRDFGSRFGKIIILNAGKYGYDNLGDGHKLDDDREIMNMLNIKFFDPKSLGELQNLLNIIDNQENGIFYIQLGKDY